MTATMLNYDLDLSLLTQEEMSLSIPCDYHGESTCKGRPAEWIAWLVQCPACGVIPMAKMMCADDKAYRIDAEEGTAVFCGHCQKHTWAPARHAYKRCERINRR